MELSESGDLRELLHAMDIRIARLEEQNTAKHEALDLIAKQLAEYKTVNNEWRSTVKDVMNNTADVVRNEGRALYDRVADRVSALERISSATAGKSAGFNASWAIAVSLIFIAIALFRLLLK